MKLHKTYFLLLLLLSMSLNVLAQKKDLSKSASEHLNNNRWKEASADYSDYFKSKKNIIKIVIAHTIVNKVCLI